MQSVSDQSALVALETRPHEHGSDQGSQFLQPEMDVSIVCPESETRFKKEGSEVLAVDGILF